VLRYKCGRLMRVILDKYMSPGHDILDLQDSRRDKCTSGTQPLTYGHDISAHRLRHAVSPRRPIDA
jgi:hypothetical protein